MGCTTTDTYTQIILILTGMYYFADGGRIDQGRSEVTDDNNAYYGAFESIDL